MSFLGLFNIGTMSKKFIEVMFSSGAVAMANHKLVENDIDAITIVGLDLIKGRIIVSLDGESRNTRITILNIEYSIHEMGICISHIDFTITVDGTTIHKKWMESIASKGIAEYIANNDGLWISRHIKKISGILKMAEYTVEV